MVIPNQQESGDDGYMSKKSCVIYDSWADMILHLPPEMAGEFAQGILKYAIYGEDIDTSNPAITAMLVPVKKKLDEDAEAWEEVKKARSEAGKKGMAKRWDNSVTGDNEVITNDNTVITNDNKAITNDNKDITNITVSVSESVYVSDKEKEKDILSDQVDEIVGYLNEKLGTNYKSSTKSTRQQIKARLDEGHTVEDFKTVIDKKVKAWKDDPKMSQYLRPETLFRPGHFESYLNEIEVNRASPPVQKKSTEEIPRAVYEKIHNFHERKYDFAALEAEALGK